MFRPIYAKVKLIKGILKNSSKGETSKEQEQSFSRLNFSRPHSFSITTSTTACARPETMQS